MKALDVGTLNSGLSRVVSTKNYPKTRRQYLPRQTKGRVFRLGVLHGKELSEAALQRNCKGYINGQVNTAAIAPSLYHWLFHRCGIPFAEAKEMVQRGRLMVDGVLVAKERDLESQLDWSTFQDLDIQVRSSVPSLVEKHRKATHYRVREDGTTASAAEQNALESAVEGPWVPALKRALHRSYAFFYAHHPISISSEVANPKSFVHRLASSGMCISPCAPEAALGLNVLRPIGFMDGIRGLALATNDVAIIRYWNNEFLGNYGVYDIRFARGTPTQVIHRAAEDMKHALAEGVQQQLSPTVKIPCACTVERTSASSPHGDVVTKLNPNKAFHEQRVVVTTPLMPYRIVQRMWKVGAVMTLVRSGPFVLTPALGKEERVFRALKPSELAVLFTMERRLKTNRMLLSLSEFDANHEQ